MSQINILAGVENHLALLFFIKLSIFFSRVLFASTEKKHEGISPFDLWYAKHSQHTPLLVHDTLEHVHSNLSISFLQSIFAHPPQSIFIIITLIFLIQF